MHAFCFVSPAAALADSASHIKKYSSEDNRHQIFQSVVAETWGGGAENSLSPAKELEVVW